MTTKNKLFLFTYYRNNRYYEETIEHERKSGAVVEFFKQDNLSVTELTIKQIV